MLLRATHYRTGRRHDWQVIDGRLGMAGAPSAAPADFEAQYVAPSWFDLQINGGGGIAFGSATLTIEQVRSVVALARQHGIGALCPTIITNSSATITHGLTVLRQACETAPALARALPRVHLEGPYIAVADGPRGAHSRQHVRPPDWEEFQRFQIAAGGRIGLVTLAPELDGAIAFIEKLARSGVVVALGHTAATADQIRAAVDAGARLSTHLGNGCATMLPRHDNPIWNQLADDDLWASIICDGHHLPATVVRCIARAKTPARLILTCDASSLAGVAPGWYREWEQDLEVLPEGKIVVAGQGLLAGSWSFTDLCIGNVMRFAGLSLADAVAMATDRPRQLLGLPVPTLDWGQPADLVLFDLDAAGQVRVRATVVNGELVPRRDAAL